MNLKKKFHLLNKNFEFEFLNSQNFRTLRFYIKNNRIGGNKKKEFRKREKIKIKNKEESTKPKGKHSKHGQRILSEIIKKSTHPLCIKPMSRQIYPLFY